MSLQPSGHPDHPEALLPPPYDPKLFRPTDWYERGDHEYRYHFTVGPYADGCLPVDTDGRIIYWGLTKTCIRCGKSSEIELRQIKNPKFMEPIDRTVCPW